MTTTKNAANQAAFRKRQAERGLVLVRVWVPKGEEWRIRDLAEQRCWYARRMQEQK